MASSLHAGRPLRASQLDPYEAHLLKRWREGCRNAASLHREIREMGYPGAQTVVRADIAYLRKHPEQANYDHPRKERAASASPRALRWLLARSPEDLTQEEQAKRTRLLAVSEEVQRVHALLQAFQEMVRQRQPEHLRPWMREATQSGIPELKSFVAGIERDYDAVKAALCLPWSQGITEGKVNKLKTLESCTEGLGSPSCDSGSYMMADLCLKVQRKREFMNFKNDSPKSGKRANYTSALIEGLAACDTAFPTAQ